MQRDLSCPPSQPASLALPPLPVSPSSPGRLARSRFQGRVRVAPPGCVGLTGTNRSLPRRAAHPAQQPGETLVVAGAPGLLREFAYGEVRLLLAGARPAEGHAPDYHRPRAAAGIVRSAAHQARSRWVRCLARKFPLPSANDHVSPLFAPWYAVSFRSTLAGRSQVRIV